MKRNDLHLIAAERWSTSRKQIPPEKQKRKSLDSDRRVPSTTA